MVSVPGLSRRDRVPCLLIPLTWCVKPTHSSLRAALRFHSYECFYLHPAFLQGGFVVLVLLVSFEL